MDSSDACPATTNRYDPTVPHAQWPHYRGCRAVGFDNAPLASCPGLGGPRLVGQLFLAWSSRSMCARFPSALGLSWFPDLGLRSQRSADEFRKLSPRRDDA